MNHSDHSDELSITLQKACMVCHSFIHSCMVCHSFTHGMSFIHSCMVCHSFIHAWDVIHSFIHAWYVIRPCIHAWYVIHSFMLGMSFIHSFRHGMSCLFRQALWDDIIPWFCWTAMSIHNGCCSPDKLLPAAVSAAVAVHCYCSVCPAEAAEQLSASLMLPVDPPALASTTLKLFSFVCH